MDRLSANALFDAKASDAPTPRLDQNGQAPGHCRASQNCPEAEAEKDGRDDMATARRLGAEGSQNRARFIDAAETILTEVGEHGISARQVAQQAGLKTQLLYYYFRTMDDLLRAVVQRINDRRMSRFEQALAAPTPLRAMWEMMRDPSTAALAAELSAIAHHREAVRAEIVTAAQAFRAHQAQAVAALLPADQAANAGGLVMIAASLARMLVSETALGLTEGHDQALAMIEAMLDQLEAK